MNARDHLPNAHHIDWVLESVKQHPKIWTAAREATWEVVWEVALEAAWDAARGVTYAAARGAAWDAAWAAAWEVVWEVALEAARDANWGAARDADQCAILALIAYDDCADLLDMPSEQLKTWALLTEQPAAVLLVPAAIARERIRELECVKA